MVGEFVFAHGIGGSKDLPISAALAASAGWAALAVSFAVLVLAWRAPRYDAAAQGRLLPSRLDRAVSASATAVVLRTAGLLFFGYVTWAAVAGPDLVINPTFGVVYVWLWVGLVPLSLLFGAWFRVVSPLRTFHLLVCRITRIDPDRGRHRLPAWVGLWPAAFGLFAFVWMELVSERSSFLATIQYWFGVYLVLGILGSVVFGARWLAAADPFEAYSTLIGNLSPFGRRGDGRLVLRSPLCGLDGAPTPPGLVAVVAVLFGSTAFDSFKDSATWLDFVQGIDASRQLVNTVALLAFCATVGFSFTIATMSTGVRPGTQRRTLPGWYAPSVVPIIVGYVTAHYLSFLLVQGQQTLIQLSDPMATGANLLGTADNSVNYWILDHPGFLAVVKVVAVITGHVLGVIAAHDRALKVLPRRHQFTGQLPLLAVMVCYTIAGILLLFSA